MSTIRCVNVLIRGIFYILFVILCFRVGIRRNNSDAINVTKARFAPLFHGLNMSFYIETFFQGFSTADKMSTTVVEFPEYNESYSVSGNDCKGEGGDFVLE